LISLLLLFLLHAALLWTSISTGAGTRCGTVSRVLYWHWCWWYRSWYSGCGTNWNGSDARCHSSHGSGCNCWSYSYWGFRNDLLVDRLNGYCDGNRVAMTGHRGVRVVELCSWVSVRFRLGSGTIPRPSHLCGRS
jgi:hypothetical protein